MIPGEPSFWFEFIVNTCAVIVVIVGIAMSVGIAKTWLEWRSNKKPDPFKQEYEDLKERMRADD